MDKPTADLVKAAVRIWLDARVAQARADQVAAERRGRDGQDDYDAAAAEEMVCTLVLRGDTTDTQRALVEALKALLERDEFVWSGVYDDRRFDRHARAYVRKLVRWRGRTRGGRPPALPVMVGAARGAQAGRVWGGPEWPV